MKSVDRDVVVAKNMATSSAAISARSAASAPQTDPAAKRQKKPSVVESRAPSADRTAQPNDSKAKKVVAPPLKKWGRNSGY